MIYDFSTATLAGIVATKPRIYLCCGEKFYDFSLSVRRLSGAEDLIPVSLPVILKNVRRGDELRLIGQVRTYNKTVEGKPRLMVSFFAQGVEGFLRYENEVRVIGYICKPPVYRTTPLGRDICELMIAVNRHNKSDYIPHIVWGRMARVASQLNVGVRLELMGRLQSREYEKLTEHGKVKKVAYEVSVNRIREVEDDEQGISDRQSHA